MFLSFELWLTICYAIIQMKSFTLKPLFERSHVVLYQTLSISRTQILPNLCTIRLLKRQLHIGGGKGVNDYRRQKAWHLNCWIQGEKTNLYH